MKILLPLLLVAAVALLPGCAKREPKTEVSTQLPPAPPVPEFDGERAFDYLLKQTSFGPRNPGSMGHAACLSYLSSTLQSFADSVRLQEFVHEGYDGESLHLTNIIASWRPADRDRILLCAHWDTRPRADQDENPQRRNEPILGANDGASGRRTSPESPSSSIWSAMPSSNFQKKRTPFVLPRTSLIWCGTQHSSLEGELLSAKLASQFSMITSPSTRRESRPSISSISITPTCQTATGIPTKTFPRTAVQEAC
jgi:hypothetical protein